MNNSPNDAPLLDDAQVAFIQGDVSINAASRDINNIASLARCYGCRVSDDRRQVTVFLSAPAATKVLNDIRSQRTVAVAFSHPPTHQTIQLKATDARVEPLHPGDMELIETQKNAFMGALRTLGYTDPFVASIKHVAIPDYIAVTFSPAAAFSQTPGPNAGQKLGGGQ